MSRLLYIGRKKMTKISFKSKFYIIWENSKSLSDIRHAPVPVNWNPVRLRMNCFNKK